MSRTMTEAERAQRARDMRDRWKDPAYRARQAEGMARAWADPEKRERMIACARAGTERRWVEAKRRKDERRKALRALRAKPAQGRPPVKVPKAAHPLVRDLFREIVESGVLLGDLAQVAGVHRDTFAAWSRHVPRIDTLDAVGMVFGKRLAWVDADD